MPRGVGGTLTFKPFTTKKFPRKIFAMPCSSTMLSFVLTVELPASQPVIDPVSALSQMILQHSRKNLSASRIRLQSLIMQAITSSMSLNFEDFCTASFTASMPRNFVRARAAINFFMTWCGVKPLAYLPTTVLLPLIFIV